MKNKIILSFAALVLNLGFIRFSYGQDSTTSNLNLFQYLFKTPWTVMAGVANVSDDNQPNPFKIDLDAKNYFERTHWYPSVFMAEKGVYDFRHWGFAKNISLQGRVARSQWKPVEFLSLDGNIKYNFKGHMGDKLTWLDPYAFIGLGYSEMFLVSSELIPLAGVYHNGKLYKRRYDMNLERDRFVGFNAGIGSNFWINDYVGINIDFSGKTAIAFSSTGGVKYVQYTAGIVFKVGGKAKKEEEVAKEETKPASNYKRTKEEEDALIHLREHLNK